MKNFRRFKNSLWLDRICLKELINKPSYWIVLKEYFEYCTSHASFGRNIMIKGLKIFE